jgi:hypothetical protein
MEDQPWEGHRSVGLLVEPDVVLVPEMAEDLLNADRDFEVLVIPLPLRLDGIIERHRPRRLDVVRVEGVDGPASANIQLATPSRYLSRMKDFDGCDFVNRLAALDRQQVWAILEEMEVVPPGTKDKLPEGVLRSVSYIERLQRRPYRRHTVARSLGEAGEWWCLFTPKCHECDHHGG